MLNQVKGWIWIWLFIGFALYFNTRNNGFVLDDESAVTKNTIVQQGIKAIPEILTTPYHYGYDQKGGGLYRPLSLVVLAIEKSIFGNRAAPMHLFQALLYGCLCASVWLLFKTMMPKVSIEARLAGTAIFTFHPIHTEVVANLKSLDELLALLFFTISLRYFFLGMQNPHPQKHIVFALIFYALALFSKESSAALLGVYGFMAWYKKGNIKNAFVYSCWLLIPVAAFFLAMGISVNSLETQGNIESVENTIAGLSGTSEQWSFKLTLLGHYLYMLFWPYPLIHDYSWPHFLPSSWGSWQIVFLIGFIAFIGVILWKNKDKWLEQSIWISIIILPLFITGNLFFLIRWTFGERFLFTSSLGISWAVVHLFVAAVKNKKIPTRGVGIFVALWCLWGGIQIVQRNADWKSNLTLFKADLPKSPDNIRILSLLGKSEYDAALQNKDIEAMKRAVDLFERAKKVKPVAEFMDGLANCYAELGQSEKAIPLYIESIKLKPGVAQIWHNLGNAYRNVGKPDSAFWAYRMALAITPDFSQTLPNIANMHYQFKNNDSALYYGRKALNTDPGNIYYRKNLGLYFESAGMMDSAKFYLSP